MHLLNLSSHTTLLVWMFCTRESNYRLNVVHERAIRTISEDYISSFSDLVTLLNA